MLRALAILACLAAGTARADCRLALVLALDISGSVDAAEFALQREGLAQALLSGAVAAAILADPEVPVRIHVFEWSGPQSQRPLVPWTEIRTMADLAEVASALTRGGRGQEGPETAIGAALLHAAAEIGRQDCWRRVIDVSGDGPSNAGPAPESLEAALLGITVNALVVKPGDGAVSAEHLGDLADYFRARVIRGPGAFAEVALGHADYRRAMERKLLRELTLLPVGALPGGASGTPARG